MSITRVSGQSTGVSDAGNNDIFSIAYPHNVTVGNLLVIGVASFDGTADVSTLTKSAGSATLGIITRDAVLYDAGSTQGLAIFSAPVTGSGDCTMQFSEVGSSLSAGYASIALQEYSGADTSLTRVDGTSIGSGTSLTPTTGTVVAPSQGAAFFGALVYNNEEVDATYTNGPGYSNVYNTSDGVDYLPCSFQDYLTNSGDTSSASWTITGLPAQPYVAVLSVYKAIAGGGPVTSTYDTPYIYIGGQWQTVIGAYMYDGTQWDSAQTCQEYISGTWQ